MAIEQLQDELAALKPVLDSAERSIEIMSAEAPKIVFKIKGFCGGCGCSSSYKDGLHDLVADYCPEFTVIEFVEED